MLVTGGEHCAGTVVSSVAEYANRFKFLVHFCLCCIPSSGVSCSVGIDSPEAGLLSLDLRINYWFVEKTVGGVSVRLII